MKNKARIRLAENRAINRGIEAANAVLLERLLYKYDQVQVDRVARDEMSFFAFDEITGAEISGGYFVNTKGVVTDYIFQTEYSYGLDYYVSVYLNGTPSAFEEHLTAFDEEMGYYEEYGEVVDIADATGNGQPLADFIDSLPGAQPEIDSSTFVVLSPDNAFFA